VISSISKTTATASPVVLYTVPHSLLLHNPYANQGRQGRKTNRQRRKKILGQISIFNMNSQRAVLAGVSLLFGFLFVIFNLEIVTLEKSKTIESGLVTDLQEKETLLNKQHVLEGKIFELEQKLGDVETAFKGDSPASPSSEPSTSSSSSSSSSSTSTCPQSFTETLSYNYDNLRQNIPVKTKTDEVVASTDIYYHFPVLKKYAEASDHVTEVGVRYGVSSFSFIQGLYDVSIQTSTKKSIVLSDITKTNAASRIDDMFDLCPNGPIDYKFIEGDDLTLKFEQTDFMFIDTWHTYKHLKQELSVLPKYVNKFIGFHDTTSFAHKNEKIAGHGGKPEDKSLYRGIVEKMGMTIALDEFLAGNKEWVLQYKTEENNGITIIARVGVSSPLD